MSSIKVAAKNTERRSFVVRVWFEPTALSGSEGELRGSITDAESLESRCFRRLADVTTFISERACVPERPGLRSDDERTPSDALAAPPEAE